MRCKQMLSLSVVTVLLAASLAGCGTSSTAPSAVSSEAPSSAASSAASEVTETAALPDGVYTAEFDTDSGMFHANEACDGKGTLTVKDGKMTFHVSLVSKKIVNLYPGLAADAEAHKTDWLLPTTDTVTYSDGTSEEVYGYDIPVTALDEDFSLAILGSKGTWYDHTVSVRNAQPKTEEVSETPADGEYTVSVALEGGSGRATVDSPATLTVADGKMTATIAWSSPNYDYMVVDGEKYLPTNTEGNSTFEIPVAALGTPLAVTADTVASLLGKLQQQGVRSFFRTDDGQPVLYCGVLFERETSPSQVFATGLNIIDDQSLEQQQAGTMRLRVKAVSLMPDNKKVKVEVGDADGELRVLHTYNKTESELKAWAEQEVKRLKRDGLTGSFKTFGYRLVDKLDVIGMKIDGEKKGCYQVKKNVIKYDTGGFRQEITLGYRVAE